MFFKTISMNRIWLLGGLLILLTVACKANAAAQDKTSGSDGLAAPAWTFPKREKLVFRLKWLGIPAGEITTEIRGVEDIRGRKAYVIEVHARTIGFCSTLYKIDDRYVSYMDVEELHALRFEERRREGSYKKDAVTDFDQEEHKAYFKSLTDGSQKVIAIPPHVQDTITAAYFARTTSLQAGRPLELKVLNSEKVYDIFMTDTARTFINVPHLGRKAVYRIAPMGKFNGKQVREGRMSGYVDVDPGHVPYYIVIKAPVFTKVTAILVKKEVE